MTTNLFFVVRRPFISKQLQTNIGYRIITENKKLKIESNMPTKGIIFSDGIESNFLNFNTSSFVEIGIADKKANLIISSYDVLSFNLVNEEY
jgi:hypothetical protein